MYANYLYWIWILDSIDQYKNNAYKELYKKHKYKSTINAIP